MIYNSKYQLLVFSVIFSLTSLFAQSPEVFLPVYLTEQKLMKMDLTLCLQDLCLGQDSLMKMILLSLTFGEGGSITFSGYTDGSSTDVYFKFEKNPYPDTEPSFNTVSVTLELIHQPTL